jgi:prolyl oligopeptidase
VLHGIEVHDPYRWLEDGASAATRAWSDAQNARTRAVLDALPDRPRLHDRLSTLLRAGTSSGPVVCEQAGIVFSLDRWGDHDQAVLVSRPLTGEGPHEPTVVLDPSAKAGADDTVAIDWYHPSWDGRFVAYGTSSGGDERSTLRVLDVQTGEHLADEIPHTRAASVGWLPDSSGFAYTRYEGGGDYDRHVFWHVLGSPWEHDEVLFADLPDPTAWPEVSVSRDGRWALLHVELGWSRVDVHLVDIASGERRTVVEGEDAVSWFGIDTARNRLVGHTTRGAGRGRIVAVDLDGPLGPDAWTELVAESDAVIEAVSVTAGSLLVASTRRAVTSLVRHDLDGTAASAIALPELGSLAGLSGNDDRDEAVLSLTSFTRPATLFRWSADGGLARWSDLPGGPDPDGFTVEQVTYASTDGVDIPLFLIGAANADTTGPVPTILSGYGGFAVTMSPAYSPLAAVMAEEGGRYAVACIRGGAEEGEEWHRAGMREHKQQVFDDFHAAADWLVAQGITTRAQLAVRGGSNGGLLMGAAITQRPDLCAAVVCAVPLLDMVRFHLFLIAKLWIPEYGDPDIAEEFAWLHAYSPYHHVVDGTCYPSVLIETGEEDSRVDPCHARKFAARLQAATSCGDEHPVLVRIEAKAGHGVGKPAGRQADELADVLSFLLWQLA